MPAPGKGPGSASGTGGPGSLGGAGIGSSGGFQGGNGLNNLGKVGPYKAAKRKPNAKEEIGAGSATTSTYEATASNIAQAVGGTLLGAAAPGIGIGLGPVAAQAAGLGYDNPTGTTDQFSSDPSQITPPDPAAITQKPVTVTPKKKKKDSSPSSAAPLLPQGLQLLAGMPGTLLGT